jgi:release factor glutamine methyltransferase
MTDDGSMYLLLSSDSDLKFLHGLIEQAGLAFSVVARSSIWIETFILYELKPDESLGAAGR